MLLKKVSAVVEELECSPVTLLLVFKFCENSYRVEIDQATYGYRFNDRAKTRFRSYGFLDHKSSYIGNSHMLVNIDNQEIAYKIFNDILTWVSKPDYYETIRV